MLTRAAAAAKLRARDLPEDSVANKRPTKRAKTAMGVDPTQRRTALGDVSNTFTNSSNVVKKSTNLVTAKALHNVPKASTQLGPTVPALRPILAARAHNKRVVVVPKRSSPKQATHTKIRIHGQDTMDMELNKSVESSDSEEDSDVHSHKSVIAPRSEESHAVTRPSRLSTRDVLSNIFAEVGLEEIEDIDQEDRNDPLQCVELVDDIFGMLREREVTDRPNPNYMNQQQSINSRMRGVLVDWMIDVGSTFTLLSETLFLGVRLMDMFLSRKTVSRDRVQLVGVTAMFIASKFEELRSPYIDDWIWVSDDAYKREHILRMEKIMLDVLNFNVGTPTPLHFLRRFSKAAKSDSRTHTLSKYLTELSMPEYSMLRFRPSQIAASAVYLARRMTGKTPAWTRTLQHHTKYSVTDLIPCSQLMNEVHHCPKEGAESFFAAVKKKYANEGLLAVSKIPALKPFE